MKYVDVDATVELQVNLAQLTDNTDFKSIEAAIAYNESGMDLKWHFQTTSGVMATPASVTPTTGGDYDWNHSNGGMYKIEVPASGGASINNDTEGYGYFSGSCDGVLAWVGPTYCFRAAATNNALINAASLLVELAKAVWDRVLNGSTHNIPSSAGRRLRSTGDALAGTVDDASATTLSFITDLTGGYTDFYADQVIHFTTGNLAGMTRIIVSFNNATKEVVLDEALPVAPADTDEFEVHPDHIHSVSSMISSMLNTVVDGTYNIAKSWGKRLIGIEEYQGYKGGFIYIDTLNGEAGSDPHVNGVVDKKVNNLADALLLAAALNMYDFQVAAGSSLVFASSQDNNSYHGHNWTLGLGGRSINSTYIHGAIDISGIATASEPPKFEHCILNGTILPPLLAVSCGLGGDMIANAAGEYVYQDCYSKVAGFGTPSFDSGVALANVNLSVRNYSGGIELKNMGQVGIDKATVEGEGQVVINDNCVGSAGSQIAMRGHQERYGGDPFEAGGGVIRDAARYAVDQLVTHIVGADGDTLESLSGQIDGVGSANIIHVAGGGGAAPSYADEGDAIKVVQGDVIDIPRYLVGNYTDKRIFFGAKAKQRDTAYAITVRECNNLVYDSVSNSTSYMIPFIAADTESMTVLGVYKAEVEVRDSDGTSSPFTPDRFDCEIVGQIIKPA